MKITGKKIGYIVAQCCDFCDYLDHKSGSGHPIKKQNRRSYTKKMRNFIKRETRNSIRIYYNAYPGAADLL